MNSLAEAPREQKKNTTILKWTKIFFKLSAATPVKFSNKYYAILYKVIFRMCCVGTFTLTTIHLTGSWIFFQRRDWDSFLDSVSYTTVTLNAAYKTTLLKEEFLVAMYNKVENYERRVQRDKGSNAVYQKYVNLARRLTIFYAVISLTTASCLAIASLFATAERKDGTRGRKLITARWYPIDIDKHYPIAFGSELLCCYSAFSHFLAIDVFVFTMFLNCMAQFRVVQHRIRNIKSYSKMVATERKISILAAEDLVASDMIKLHNGAIDMTNEVDTRLKSYFFFEFIVSSIRVSVGAISVMWRKLTTVDYIANSLYVVTLLTEIYLYYWNANEIAVESTDGVYTAAAMSDYEDINMGAQKKLIILLLRAKIPSTISIGRLDKMSLDTLIKIMKACYYYVSLLVHFRGEP